MKSIHLLSLAVTALMSLALPAHIQADTMYGGNGNGSTNAGFLVTIDQVTGAGTIVGDPVTPGGLTGLAFDLTGMLFGSTIAGPGSTSNLVTINPVTGALISTVGPITPVGGSPISISDLALDPLTGILYGIQSNAGTGSGGGNLYTIDKLTGAATFLGNANSFAGGGIAFTPDGKLYQTAYDVTGSYSLNQLNPVDASRISSTPLDTYYDGLGIRSDGTFFATSSSTTDSIYTIDPITGTATLVGQTGTGSTSDFAFRGASTSVPDSGSFFMFPGAIALLFVGRRFVRAARA